MLAQHGAQRGVQQVRGRVVAHGGAAQRSVDLREELVAAANRRGRDNLVNRQAGDRRRRSFDLGELLAAFQASSAPRSPTWPPDSA